MRENLGKIRSQKKSGMRKNSWSSQSSHPIPAAPRIPGIKTRFLRKMGREKKNQTNKKPAGFGAFPALWEFPGSAIPKKFCSHFFPGEQKSPFPYGNHRPPLPFPEIFPLEFTPSPRGIHPEGFFLKSRRNPGVSWDGEKPWIQGFSPSTPSSAEEFPISP